jgi:mannose-1-phosphate guanylyltransferase
LLQDTAARLTPLAPPERTLVVCGPAHAAAIARQLPAVPAGNIVVEPSPKGSGPAIALATALIARHDPAVLIGSFAADHRVADPAAFDAAVRTAVAAAESGWLVTLGLTPTRPETGYGYIERTDQSIVATVDGTAYRAARFVEKPDLATATEYVASGRFLWNASMFIWRADALLAEVARLQPALHAAIEQIVAAWDTPQQEQVTAEVWAGLAETTIDHGIMEHAARVAVVPADLGWSDVGDWHGLGELIANDGDGNSLRGDCVQVATRRSVVWSETDRVVALVGIDNTAVIDTPDALLVVNRDHAQDVKRIVEQLKRVRRTEL